MTFNYDYNLRCATADYLAADYRGSMATEWRQDDLRGIWQDCLADTYVKVKSIIGYIDNTPHVPNNTAWDDLYGEVDDVVFDLDCDWFIDRMFDYSDCEVDWEVDKLMQYGANIITKFERMKKEAGLV